MCWSLWICRLYSHVSSSPSAPAASCPPPHRDTSVSSPGLPLKRERFRPIVRSSLCKHGVCPAAPSMFTVNGSLCHVCLLSLSLFNPHIRWKPAWNPVIVLISLTYRHTQTHFPALSWVSFLLSSTKHVMKKTHTLFSYQLSFYLFFFLVIFILKQISTNQLPDGDDVTRTPSYRCDKGKKNGSVTLPTSPTPGCQIEDLIVDILFTTQRSRSKSSLIWQFHVLLLLGSSSQDY